MKAKAEKCDKHVHSFKHIEAVRKVICVFIKCVKLQYLLESGIVLCRFHIILDMKLSNY